MAQAINLQITPSNVMPKIYASQFDIGREIEISLYDGASAYTPPVGTDIRFEGKKPDGNGFSYACTYTGNVVTIVTTDQMTVLAGEIPCELRMSLNGNDLGTLNIIFVIEKSPIDENVPMSDTEIPAIVELARDEQYTAEAWAIGERNGVPVGPEDPAYHNNAKYWAEHAEYGALDDLTDVEITTPTNGQVVTYNGTSQKWENKDIPSDTVTQAIIAPVEGATSLHAYVVGEQLIYNDTLYKVIAPISVNDSLVVDTNIEVSPKTVIEQVEDNASDISDIDAEISAICNVYGSKNLLHPTNSSTTPNGATITYNADGTITKSGTVSGGDAQFAFAVPTNADYVFPARLVPGRKYRLSGCPLGGSNSTYEIYIQFRNADNTAWGNAYHDYGDGIEFTAENARFGVYARALNGNTSTVTFSPMICDASIKDRTYVPYAPTNHDCMSYAVNAKLGAHNFLKNRLAGKSTTVNALTFTADENGVITASIGTAAGTNNSVMISGSGSASWSQAEQTLQKGTYIASVGGGGSSTLYMKISVEGASPQDYTVYGNNEVQFTVPSDSTRIIVYLLVINGAVVTSSNNKFYPMIRLASDTDTTYAPYTKTNRELTLSLIPEDISSQVTAQAAEIGSFKVYRLGKIVIVSVITTSGIEVGTGSWVRRSLLTGLPYTSTNNSIGISFQTVTQKIPCSVEMSGGELRCAKEYGATSAVDYSQAYFRINFVYVCD